MKFVRIKNCNKNFENDGVLYFIQRLEEMLNENTDHIFKSPILNAYLLVKEYISTTILVKDGKIDETHLKYIMDEFQESIRKDIVVNENVKTTEIDYILNKINTSAQQDHVKIMRYILYLLKDYYAWCKNYVKKIVKEEKEKKKIEQAIRCFIPCLINAGYTQDFIIDYIKLNFYGSRNISIENFNKFIDRFDFKKRDYTIYFALSKEVLKYKKVLSDSLQIVFDFNEDVSDFEFNKKRYIIAKIETKALDEYAYKQIIQSRLDIFLDFHQFISNKNENWIYDKVKVVEKESNNQKIITQKIDCGFRPLAESFSGGVSMSLIAGTLNNAEKNAYNTIKTALKSHNVALKDNYEKNVFLNLWSVFEILFISSQTKSKIAEIEENVISVLKRDYIQSLKQDLEKQFLDNLSQKFLELIKSSINEKDWMIQLLISKQYMNLIQEINKKLKEIPLIRTKLSSALEKYQNKEVLHKDVKRYEQRIRWHLRRLYRARNSIIHAGKIPPNITQLCQHLHCYVDGCLLEIVYRLAHQNKLSTIDNAIIDIKLRNEKIEKILSEKGPLKTEDIELVFTD